MTRWQFYLPSAKTWVNCTRSRAIVWLKSGGLVRCTG